MTPNQRAPPPLCGYQRGWFVFEEEGGEKNGLKVLQPGRWLRGEDHLTTEVILSCWSGLGKAPRNCFCAGTRLVLASRPGSFLRLGLALLQGGEESWCWPLQRGRSGPRSLGSWLGLRLWVVVVAHGAPGACSETFERLSDFLIHEGILFCSRLFNHVST